VTVDNFYWFAVPICKTKWKSLSYRYRKELSKLDLPSGSRVSSGKPWEYLDHLSFLKSYHTIPEQHSKEEYPRGI